MMQIIRIIIYRFQIAFQNYNVYIFEFNLISLRVDRKVILIEKEKNYKNIGFIKLLLEVNSCSRLDFDN